MAAAYEAKKRGQDPEDVWGCSLEHQLARYQVFRNEDRQPYETAGRRRHRVQEIFGIKLSMHFQGCT